MLPSKLLVPIHTRFAQVQTLMNYQSCLRCSRKAAAGCSSAKCPRRSETVSPFHHSRSEKYNEALRRCPRAARPGHPCQTQQQAQCPAAPANAAEVYTTELDKARQRAYALQAFTCNATREIARSMDEETASRLAGEKEKIVSKLREIECKVEDVMKLSIVCGHEKRNESYAIAENIHAKLQTWQCENEWGERYIRHRLETLECRVKERTETAIGIIRTCRGCVSPDTIVMCVEMTSNDAGSILKHMEDHASKDLASIEKHKKDIVEENNRLLDKIMREFELEAKTFMDHLCLCRLELEKLNKKC